MTVHTHYLSQDGKYYEKQKGYLMTRSIFTTGDSYKYGHSNLLPNNCVSQYNYLESRGGLYPSTVFTGLQYYIKEFMMTVPTTTEVTRFETLAKLHGVPFDKKMWDYIVELGYYPIEICAIPEGTLVPTHHVLATFESTDPKAVGIVGFLETLFMKVWMPTTVATKSYYVRQMLEKYGSPEWAQFAYHNFGNRSATSEEHAMIAGFAHLTQFMGTDSFGSLAFAEDYYSQPIDIAAGYSVLATEHSITTMNTRDGEEQFVYETILANPESNILSFVGDSYDIYKFVEFCISPNSRIRRLIESRPHQKLVIRPDSGDPFEVIERILQKFYTHGLVDVSSGKGVISNFGILWGDGITPETIEKILDYFTVSKYNYAAENFVFGSGTDLVNGANRDTQKFAIKCSSIAIKIQFDTTIEDTPRYILEDIDVFKDPITDPGKASKKGKVTTWFDTETKEYISGHRSKQPNLHCVDIVTPVFKNGKLLKDYSLEDLRKVSNG